jgi:hypothetical protein
MKLKESFSASQASESGQAITEYLVLMVLTLPLIFWLFHPDNELYVALRDQLNLTNVMLLFPGP